MRSAARQRDGSTTRQPEGCEVNEVRDGRKGMHARVGVQHSRRPC